VPFVLLEIADANATGVVVRGGAATLLLLLVLVVPLLLLLLVVLSLEYLKEDKRICMDDLLSL
jgi:hypothetical protein